MIRVDCQSEDLDLLFEKGDNPFTMRSLGLLLVALVSLLAIEGCGSDTNNKPITGTGGAGGALGGPAGGGPVQGNCMPSYCPPVNGMAACCLNNGLCGYTSGTGCLPSGIKPDAGAH